jgi:Amt family ammonium transporter
MGKLTSEENLIHSKHMLHHLADIQTNALEISQSVNILLVLFSTFLVFFMQPGFALLEVGQVRAKNAANVMMKNLMDWSQGVLSYFLVGAAVAYLVGSLTSSGRLALGPAFSHFSDQAVFAELLFGAVFAMTAATIVSGAVVGRIKFNIYLVFGVTMTTLIYPVVQGLAWNGLLTSDGFLGSLFGAAYLDFAGGTVVHMTGGIAGLIAAWMIGPRANRYQGDTERAIPGHSVFFSLLGAFVLAFGWYGFNIGSYATVMASDGTFEGHKLALVAMNTTLAMGAGAIAAGTVSTVERGTPDPLFAANGLVAGLVSITAGAVQVTWWASILIGGIGGALVIPVYNLVVRDLQIDDAIGVFPVHAVPGAVGALLIPVFAPNYGLNQLFLQAIGITVISVWVSVSTIVTLGLIKHVLGINLRVSQRAEEIGLDASEHNIMAYPEFVRTVGDNMAVYQPDRDLSYTSPTRGAVPQSDPPNNSNKRNPPPRSEGSDMSAGPAQQSETVTTVWRGQEVEVSQRTEYEHELEAITNRLELALDETNTGVWEWNIETDELILDEASERLLGGTVDNSPNTFSAFLDRVHPADVETVEQQIDTTLDSRDREYDADFRIQLSDGTERWISARGVVKYTDGEPTHILGIQTDLTERKERQRELEQQNERLDQFASMVSHDLRNPLNVAQLRTDMLLREQENENAEATQDALERMETMIEEMLTLARAGQDIEATEQCRLSDLVANAWENVQTGESELRCRLDDETAEVDRNRTIQVFENLFRNALDHNEGPLVVRVGTLESGSGLYVEDDGDGIPENERDNIFDHGYTTNEGGSGLGLAIVSDIVDAHGWSITATEGNNGGARFEMYTN